MNERTARRRNEALQAYATMMAVETQQDDYLTMDEGTLEELCFRHFRMDGDDPFWFWDHVLDMCRPWREHPVRNEAPEMTPDQVEEIRRFIDRYGYTDEAYDYVDVAHHFGIEDWQARAIIRFFFGPSGGAA